MPIYCHFFSAASASAGAAGAAVYLFVIKVYLCYVIRVFKCEVHEKHCALNNRKAFY